MKTRLKEARKAAGYNQKEAAEAFGVSLGTYRNWEQGRVVMNGEQLIGAARLFGTDVDYLLMTDTADIDPEAQADELSAIYRALNEDGRDTLLIIARGLLEKFRSEE